MKGITETSHGMCIECLKKLGLFSVHLYCCLPSHMYQAPAKNLTLLGNSIKQWYNCVQKSLSPYGKIRKSTSISCTVVPLCFDFFQPY